MTLKERYAGVIAWFEEHMPVAESELAYGSPYELLVAVILSAQCTDKRVNMTTPALFEAFPTPQAMAAATPEQIYPYIKSISYPNNKAKNLAGMARMLCEEFGGEVPSDLKELQRLRRGTQDGQCRGRRDLAEGGDARRYPRIPGLEPHRTHEPVENTLADRAYSRKTDPFAPAADGPPLADSSRPLRLYGACPQMCRVRYFDLVPQICRRQQTI